MNHDVKDRILDACLEEVLGGQTPPDFTSRIIQALDSRADASSGNGAMQGSSMALSSTGGDSSPVVVASRKPMARRQTRNRWLSVALTASILAVVVSVGALVFQLVDRSQKSSKTVAEPKSSSDGITDKNVRDGVARNQDVAPPP